jgi:hypothetical protein
MSSFTPTRRIVNALGMTVWGLTRLGWEMVVWGNVRAGSVSLSNTPRSFRLLIRLATWLSLGLLILLLFSDVWRRFSPLDPLVFYTDALAGLYLPRYFIPVALGLLALAWAYLLCGALHAPGWAALIVLFLFGVFDFGMGLTLLTGAFSEVSFWLEGFAAGFWAVGALLVHVMLWLTLLVFAGIRRFRPVRLGLEFPLCLFITSVLLFSNHYGAQLSLQTFQTNTAASALQLTETLATMSTLLTPFLLISGAEVASFALSLTQAAGLQLRKIVTPTLRYAWVGALIVFLLFRLGAQWIAPLWIGNDLPFRWGAVIIGCILLGAFFLVRARAAVGELPGWVIPGAALILYSLTLVITLASSASGVLVIGVVALEGDPRLVERGVTQFFTLIAEWNEFCVSAFVLLLSLGLWVRARFRRRPFPSASLYGFIFVAWLAWWILTRPDRPLGALNFRHEHLYAFSTLALGVVFAGSALLRRLNDRNLLLLTAAALAFWLLEFQTLLSDPLSPLFALLGAQAALVSVGIFLNVMGAGGRFGLNLEGGRFHRFARSLMYFGYALLTIITINWLAVSHNADGLRTNDLITQNGFTAIGLPLVFWALLSESETALGRAAPPAP